VTCSIATIGTVTDVDFRDIRITGAGGTLTGTRIGDLYGNSSITFSTPKNCFRIGTGNWSGDQWSDTSGGSVSTDNFPLAQDTAVFDENTSAGTHTMNSAIFYAGSVNAVRGQARLQLVLPLVWRYGNWTLGAGMTISGYTSKGIQRSQHANHHQCRKVVYPPRRYLFTAERLNLPMPLTSGERRYRHQRHLRHQGLQRDGWGFVVQQQQRARD
jgi:hypothetical protein